MNESDFTRRLTTIVAMDVVGYSRLMGANEAGTLAHLKKCRAIIDPLNESYGGRLINTSGDGLLLEFSSVVDAVTCAIEVQTALVEYNADLDDDEKMLFRIGINLGDILADDGDIFGEGVNIAARIEALAEPGGICISRTVRDSVRDRISVDLGDMGDIEVKNIARPVRVYQVLFEGQKLTARHKSSITRKTYLAAAAICIAALAAGAAWWDQQSDTNLANMSSSNVTLPDKPSIAVLPFDNFSDDPAQDTFAIGMTEDLITDLSKVSGLFVVARNSSFAYKADDLDVRVVAAELGVGYILKGSIRKIADRVRINAQLIDVKTGEHLWSERYDRPVDDIFELQDEVGARVVAALSVQLTPDEENSLKRIHTNNLEAYELFIRARESYNPPVPERTRNALRLFKRVIEMDPEFAGGYAGVATMMSRHGIFGYGDASNETKQAIKMAKKAIAVDETFGWSYIALGYAQLANNQHEDAIAAGREAIAHQPSDADSHADLGFMLGYSGEYAAGVTAINRAIRLNPRYFNGHYLNVRGIVQTFAGDYQAALASFKENVERGGPVATPVLAISAAAHQGLGQSDEAAKITEQLRAESPQFTITNWNFLERIKDAAVRDRITKLMHAAGVP